MPSSRNVGAHWPTNRASCCRPDAFNTSEVRIDPPADVPGARVGHGTPPGVMPPALLEFAESVDEAGFDEGAETGAFLDGEPVIANVGLGIGEVNLGVGHVEITAKYDRFLAL